MWRKLTSAKTIRDLNGILALLWAVLTIPTIIWWKDSILWVAVASIYANFISQATAYLAGRVEVRTERVEQHQAAQERLDREREEHIEDMVRRLEVQNLASILWLRQIASDVEWLRRPPRH